ISSSNYQLAIALIFAIEEINRNPLLLPNVSLGYDIHTAGPQDQDSSWKIHFWLTGKGKFIPNYTCRREEKSMAAITGPTWDISSLFGTFLGLYNYPLLTFGPFEADLNDPGKFPSVYQMATKDSSLVLGMVSLMVHFRWNWVGLVISEEKGIQFLSELVREMERNRVCVAFTEMIPVNHMLLMNGGDVYSSQIVMNSAKIIIIYGDTDSSLGVFFRIWEHVLPWRIWVTTSQWEVFTAMRHFILDSFHGTLIFSQHHGEISTFKDFVKTVTPSKYPEDIFLARLWEIYFNCTLSDASCKSVENCSSRGSLEWLPWYHFDTAMSDGSYHVYNAVYAVAHTIHKILMQQVDKQSMKIGVKMKYPHWKLNHILKNIKFINPGGDSITLNPSEKLYVEYDILNFWNFPQGLGYKVKVGTFSPYLPPGQQLSLLEDRIEWSTEDQEVGGILQSLYAVKIVVLDSGNLFRKAKQSAVLIATPAQIMKFPIE
ncbi:hypothetical protein U0070_025160, partial [Myodes glareolus]